MSDLSHQVKPPKRRTYRLALALVPVVGAAGCATGGFAERTDFAPITLLDDEALPQITVYGNLLDLLEAPDETSALEEFLYGPAPARSPYLRNPQGLAMNGDVLLVCDQGQFAVVGVNFSTGRIKRWTEYEHAPRCPVAAATDDAGRVFVADTTWRAVLVYDADGRFLRELSPSDAPDRTFRPAAVMLREGVLYIGNVGDHGIARYDLAAERWLDSWAPPTHGRARFTPTGLTFFETLLTVDCVNGTVHRLLEDGTCESDIGRLGRGAGEFVRPKHGCVTANGLLFVTDAGRQSVLVFDAAGDDLAELHEMPGYWHGLTLPAGVVAFTSDRAPLLRARFESRGWPVPDEFVVVSDSLGGAPLVLFGITARSSEGGHVG